MNESKDNSEQVQYTLRIERTIVDKLGLQMYDKASAVVAEIIANAYDADAERVTVKLPIGKFLAVKKSGIIEQRGYVIEVEDNGHGMTPNEADDLYLRVGADRRKNPHQGSTSREKGRKVMGRKGIGKLAPFGICKTIEIRSAGGPKTEDGYRVTHFELDYDKIIEQTEGNEDTNYRPNTLDDDYSWDETRGTRIILRNFAFKKIPDREILKRQLASRFGLTDHDFEVNVVDTKEEEPDPAFTIQLIDIPTMDATRVDVSDRPVKTESGLELPVNGWIGMAKDPHKDEPFAGIRIYARGKIVSWTRDFGIPSGFEGEYVMRSYLVGAIHADWLDDEEDLIQTHRQDILWSSDLGKDFEKWGQSLVKEVAKRGRKPRSEKTKLLFLQISKLKEKAEERFSDSEIVKAAIDVGEKLGGFASEEELRFNDDYVNDLAELILSVAPHKLLVDAFRSIGNISADGKIDIKALLKLIKSTKIAQLASFGQIVTEKLKTIDVLQEAIGQVGTDERELQKILEDAPWLINSRWEPVTANRNLKNFQEAFESWFHKKYHKDIVTSASIIYKTKKPDFIMLDVESAIVIVEIKPPKHTFNKTDWDRFNKYLEALQMFLVENPVFLENFPNGYMAIIIADSVNVDFTISEAIDSLERKGKLKRYEWSKLIEGTKKDHEKYLLERDKF
ncbi:ATP-binding protein [candidate division LCP-89 bacterium B3_LCP]|uniref:ATP-binding protein n=1 Tax=candidate division LCP-89 bacterium B3_LCP TaxID=2012998 RepID=A0A532UYN4_UNCL8|nr:MAG: ATP-binding protein [candidate division LCP-89 bacterium B3_LCP]